MPRSNSRDAAILMRASKILCRFASNAYGKHKYSEQWVDELGDGLEEVAKTIDTEAKSLTQEEEPS